MQNRVLNVVQGAMNSAEFYSEIPKSIVKKILRFKRLTFTGCVNNNIICYTIR